MSSEWTLLATDSEDICAGNINAGLAGKQSHLYGCQDLLSAQVACSKQLQQCW